MTRAKEVCLLEGLWNTSHNQVEAVDLSVPATPLPLGDDLISVELGLNLFCGPFLARRLVHADAYGIDDCCLDRSAISTVRDSAI